MFKKISIKQKLTILLFIAILVTLVLSTLLSYFTLRQTELKAGNQKIKALTAQLSAILASEINNRNKETMDFAGEPVLINFLLERDDSSSLQPLIKKWQHDSAILQTRLLDISFHVLKEYNTLRYPLPDPSVLRDSMAIKPRGSVMAGKLYKMNKDSVIYPVVISVTHNGKKIGYLVVWRLQKSSPAAIHQLSQFMGGAVFYIGNRDGTQWTDLNKPVTFQVNAPNDIHLYQEKNKVSVRQQPLAGTPWQLWLELPNKQLTENLNRFLYRVIVIGFFLLCLGAFVARKTGNRFSSPLVNLTRAASQFVAGTYTGQFRFSHRFDELGKLSRAFNAMAWKIKKAQLELEKKAADYQLLFHSNPIPMIIGVNPSGNIMDVNEAALKHYGYSKTEFLELNLQDIRPAEDIPKYLDHIKGKSNEDSRGIWRHKTKNGTIIMVDVMASNITYNDQNARLILVNDITEKLQVEAQLLRHRQIHNELIREKTLQVEENIKENLGKELHDNINQILAATKLYLDVAKHGDPALLKDAVNKSFDNVNLAINEIRELSHRLVSPVLIANLSAALSEMINEIQIVTPLQFSLTAMNISEDLLSPELKLSLFRIVQEQINNILKHAAAGNVDIILSVTNNRLSLEIRDDGIGFNRDMVTTGIGLGNIEQRVARFHGDCRITSQPGKGTQVHIRIPIP